MSNTVPCPQARTRPRIRTVLLGLCLGAAAVSPFNTQPYEASVSIRFFEPHARSQVVSSPSGLQTFDLSVLTINVAGLPWPISSGRTDAMTEIGKQIAALSASGARIDIILIQEGFVSTATGIAEILDFPDVVSGLDSSFQPPEPVSVGNASESLGRKWWKGEALGKWLGRGLHIFSAYPVVGVKRMAFGEPACAGYDCLANKGAVLAQVLLPGLPEPVDIITTHLNSTHAAGVPQDETHRAHQQQIERLADFWSSATDPHHPTVMAGDFNMRDSHQRFVPFAKVFQEAEFVKNSCSVFGGPTQCDIEIRPNAPWLASQDLQAYLSVKDILIQSIEEHTVLHEPVNGEALSDHYGYLVH